MNLELGAGKIRFVPKERGLRMITNMKNATKIVSLNLIMKCAFCQHFLLGLKHGWRGL